jgi:RNA polymerase sigma factor (sigma-70 family)
VDDQGLMEKARAAASGNRDAAEEVLAAIEDGVYRLSVRMLGHPEDARDATQEILVVVLTHLAAFRGESAFRTWVWRIAANHLVRFRRGRRETIDFDLLAERLDVGLAAEPSRLPEAEANLYAREIRLRCTQAMLLCLDRDSRIAYIVGDILGLSGDEAASILDLDPATYRKRLSRARGRLYAFMRERCGVYDAANPCRCDRQVDCALERGILKPDEPLLVKHPVREGRAPGPIDRGTLERGALEVEGLLRVAEVMRAHPAYAAPETLIDGLRNLLRSGRLKLIEG